MRRRPPTAPLSRRKRMQEPRTHPDPSLVRSHDRRAPEGPGGRCFRTSERLSLLEAILYSCLSSTCWGASRGCGPGRKESDTMSTAVENAEGADSEATILEFHVSHHSHRDVNGGWLRPAVFGAMDGLVSNLALISGVA